MAELIEIRQRSRRTADVLTVASSCVLASLLFPRPAVSAEENGGDDSAGRLQEVVVSAQRRVERLQDVPISAQVIGNQALAEQSLNSLGDLTQVIPDVHVGPSGATSDMYIRGVGSGGNESFDQSVGLFIDDIYHGRSRTSQATFLDLDRVEVLKGPQTTFFGNNAIAGALNVVTRKPGDTLDATVRALYGMFGQYAVEGAAGGPLTDSFGVRLAATANGGSGWIKNVITGRHVPDANNLAGRLTLSYKPLDDVEATLKIEGSKHHESGAAFTGQPFQIVNCPPPAPITPNFAGPGCAQYLSVGSLPTGFRNNLTADDPGQGNELSTFEDVLALNYRAGGHTITSVTGFYNYHFDLNFGNDGTPLQLLTTEAPEKYSQFSQELRVASPTDEAIEYLAGAYFQSDKTYFGLENNYVFANPFIPASSPLAAHLPLGRNITFAQNEHSYAVFGSVSWNATDSLKVSGGIRGSWVNKDYTQNLLYGTGTRVYGGFVQLSAALVPSNGFFGQGIPGVLGGRRSDKDWMPSARVQYKLNQQAMLYFSYARGFKAGGFNGTDTSGIAANQAFNPEHVNAYEVGLKSEWLDNRLLLNAAVFRSDYSDLQVAINQLSPGGGPAALLVRNAATSRSQGVEFEEQWVLNRAFRLTANVTYLESYYVRYRDAGSTVVDLFKGIQTQDLSGSPTEFAPRWSGSVHAIFSVPLPGDLKLTTDVSPYFSARYYLHDSDDPFFEQRGYVRLDGRISLERSDGHWGVDLIGKNLTDRTILAAIGSLYTASKEQPRNVAVQVRYHF